MRYMYVRAAVQRAQARVYHVTEPNGLVLVPIAARRPSCRHLEGYRLCVCNLQPHKSLRTLINAYVRLRQAGAIGHRLALVGRTGRLYDETFAMARASGYAEQLVFTGYVPDEDLVALYNAADMFVYPSIFEGFGLPP